jgi:putative iron-dependent peroxidase
MVDSSDRVPIEPQSIIAPLSRAAIFLVLSIGGTTDAVRKVRGVIADIGGLVRTVGFRDLQGRLSCNVAIGSAAWDRFGQPRRPAQLRPFAEIRGRCTPPWQRREICCSTYGPIAPICVSSSSGSFSTRSATP